MGGFILFKNNLTQLNYNESLDIFKKKKQTISKEINFLDFKLFTFNKCSFENKNFFHIDNEDFVVSTGTPIYKSLTGEAAARELYNDFKESHDLDFTKFNGHFCYIIFINKELFLFNDFNGIYHIYHDENFNIISNSFLAISNSLKSKEILSQGLYEYIFYGTTFGPNSILGNIKQLNNKKIIKLTPRLSFLNKVYSFKYTNIKQNFNEALDSFTEDLFEYFKIVTETYKNFSLGLSGGFDSRLILSLLLKYNVKPFSYTNGNPDTTEVKVSKGICKSFELEFENYYENEMLPERDYLNQIIKEKFIFDDGFNLFGIFYSILSKDLEHSKKAMINLNGMGGEIYRARWNLPNKDIELNNFINAKLIDFSMDMVSNKFNKAIFVNNLSKKIIDNLDLEFSGSKLSPHLTNLIYPNFKLRYWGGRTISKINQFYFSLLPFSEPFLYLPSITIPIKYKVAGKFEAALIKKINPDLAKHNSNYGFNFFDGPDFKTTIIEWSKVYAPTFFRRFVRKKVTSKMSDNELNNMKRKQKLVLKKDLFISEYINIDKILEKDMYSRALTIEYFLQNYM